MHDDVTLGTRRLLGVVRHSLSGRRSLPYRVQANAGPRARWLRARDRHQGRMCSL